MLLCRVQAILSAELDREEHSALDSLWNSPFVLGVLPRGELSI